MVAVAHCKVGGLLRSLDIHILRKFLAGFFLTILASELHPFHPGGCDTGNTRADPVANRIQNDRA